MGSYINRGNNLFAISRNTDIYVDKSLLISHTNSILNTEQCFMCFSRPRRFGKTMAANMLAAYYDESCDSAELFRGLKIEKDPTFLTHLNKYPVIFIDMAGFLSDLSEKKDVSRQLKESLCKELCKSYPEVVSPDDDTPAKAISSIFQSTGKRFIVIIDEWDALFRECPQDTAEQDAYILFLRSLFKNGNTQAAIALAYLTGILPIKRDNTQSALNNIEEFTMLNPWNLAPFVGFTEDEVKTLCREHHMDYDEMERWYDGYSFGGVHSIYSPYSVVKAITYRSFKNYWTSTSSFDDAKDYINMNLDGLKDDVLSMLDGKRIDVNTFSFANDFVTLHNKDQVMTLLVHLGYLAYDEEWGNVYIPNLEVKEMLEDSIAMSDWGVVSTMLRDSASLLKATLQGDEKKVASIVGKVHDRLSSFISYSGESDLAIIIRYAYAAAECYYSIQREAVAGRGYADAAFTPRKGRNIPPLIIELEWDRDNEEAKEQVNRKKYLSLFSDYKEAIVCTINYGVKDKEHLCTIETVPCKGLV